MLKKLKRNFIIVLVPYVLLIVVLFFTDGYDKTLEFVKAFWWVLIALPLFFRFYGWFSNLKNKAYDLGADLTSSKKNKKEE